MVISVEIKIKLYVYCTFSCNKTANILYICKNVKIVSLFTLITWDRFLKRDG